MSLHVLVVHTIWPHHCFVELWACIRVWIGVVSINDICVIWCRAKDHAQEIIEYPMLLIIQKVIYWIQEGCNGSKYFTAKYVLLWELEYITMKLPQKFNLIKMVSEGFDPAHLHASIGLVQWLWIRSPAVIGMLKSEIWAKIIKKWRTKFISKIFAQFWVVSVRKYMVKKYLISNCFDFFNRFFSLVF